MRVLDTSVIYKWYVEEEGTAKALLLRDDFVKKGVETVLIIFSFFSLSPYMCLSASIFINLRPSAFYFLTALFGVSSSL